MLCRSRLCAGHELCVLILKACCLYIKQPFAHHSAGCHETTQPGRRELPSPAPRRLMSVARGPDLAKKYPHSEFCGLRIKAESYITPKGPLKCKRCRRFATLLIVNPKQTGLRLTADVHGERPAIERVSHSAVLLSLRQGESTSLQQPDVWLVFTIQGVPGGMDQTSGECSLC